MEQQIIFSNDIQQSLNTALGGLDYNKTVIITDVNTRQFVFPKIADVPVVKESPCIVINSGDINKTVETAATVWKQLETAAATRRTVVINIGGGVVTDLGGFAASVFKRGLRFINMPTTLLGAVDAAIGGKTGVNFGGLKNEIGVFNEACAVVVSTLFFDTLPPTELKSGYAEMLKHGLLSDRKYFADLLGYDITSGDRDTLARLREPCHETHGACTAWLCCGLGISSGTHLVASYIQVPKRHTLHRGTLRGRQLRHFPDNLRGLRHHHRTHAPRQEKP